MPMSLASPPACFQGFYSVHGEDALFVARQFYKTTAVVKYLGKQDSGLPGTSLTEVEIYNTQHGET